VSAKSEISRNPYGHFDAERREYVITRPDTPTPWINYLGEGRYGGIVSNTGGGYSFDRDPRNRRVTRYRYNSIPADQPGRYVYLRDQDSGEFWSPTWQPTVTRKLDAYECRHGAAYTRISSEYRGIAAILLYFVPPAPAEETCPCEVWVLRVRNVDSRERRLRAFSYVELCYWDAVTDQTNLDWGMHIVHSECVDGVVRARTQFKPTVTFFASSQAPVGFDTDRDVFVGPCRDLGAPLAVERGACFDSQAPRGNNIGTLCHELLLAPGEERELIYILGVTDAPETIDAAVARYRVSANVEAAFEARRRDWDEYLAAFTVETPDGELDAMINFWNAVQCRSNLYWSRFVSGYDTGLGRGMGTRDSAQDTLGTVHSLPGTARDLLSALWRLQFADGHTWHQVFPLTGEGGPGLAGEFPQWPQWFSDDHLWLVLGTCAYLRETGDVAYLETCLPFQEGAIETVWGHVLRAVQFTLDNRGPHGLPRIGFADWDDTANLDHGSGKAESVWTGMQFCRAVLDLAELCDHLGKTTEAARFRSLHAEMAGIIDATSWDGSWYMRSYDDEGRPVGQSSARVHKIALNPQTWSVIGELGDLDRQRKAMESAHDKLNTPFGLRLIWPPYDRYEASIQGTTTFPPGAKENGGIFCHANTWAIVAAARLGWADRAYEYYRQIMPLARTDVDVYKAEPYVYCQNICSPEHPHYGLGRNTWLTGTAAWTYVAATQWILGIRPTYTGLEISPTIPRAWPGFQASRLFRGVRYEINVVRAGAGDAVRLTVDGKPIEGRIVAFPPEGTTTVRIEARLS
jgi:cellobiose phosphorylase